MRDFFQNLLVPVLTGQLKVDIDDTNEILNYWKDSSHYQQTDKPVQRFLLEGQEFSKDFLSRCLEMAQDAFIAHEENDLPTYDYDELYLPDRVVRRFGEWFDEFSERAISNTKEKGALSKSSFIHPKIKLDTGLDEIRVYIPPQRVELSEAKEAYFESLIKGQTFSRTSLNLYKRDNRVIETSSDEISLDLPAEKYTFRLIIDNDEIKVWEMKGLNNERPFLTFAHDSNNLIENDSVPPSYIWIVIPRSYSLVTNTGIIESWVPLYHGWKEYQYCLVDASSSQSIAITSSDENKTFNISVSSDNPVDLKFEGGQIISQAKSVDQPIYVGKPPNLSVPIYDQSNPESEIKKLRLSIIPKGETSVGNKTINVNLGDLIYTMVDQDSMTIELSSDQLLGLNPAGSFVIRLRGRLGRDKQLHLTAIPLFELEFDESFYLPDENGKVVESILSIKTIPDAIPTITSGVNLLPHLDDGQYDFTVLSNVNILNVLWTYECNSREIQVPITIQVPRLRWSLRGFAGKYQNEWLYVPIEITLSEFEASSQLDLLVDAPCPDDCNITLILDETEKKEQKHVSKSVARFNLLSFSDELRNLEQPISTFYLEIKGNKVEPVRAQILKVRTEWIVEKISLINQVIENGNVCIRLLWEEKGRIRNRAIRLWNLCQPWKEPYVKSIPPSLTEIAIESRMSDFQQGEYRLEFCEDDRWAVQATPTIIPDDSAINIFSMRIGDQNNLLDRYYSLGTSFREQLEKLALLSFMNDQSKLNEQIHSIRTELLTNEDLVDVLMLMLTWLPDKSKIQKLWDTLAGKTSEKEFEKVIREFQTDLDENDKKRVITVALSINLTPPDSPYEKHQLVVHKKREWLGEIIGFSPKQEKGQWLIEIRFFEKKLGKNLLRLDIVENDYRLVNESELLARMKKIIQSRNPTRNR